MLGGVHQDVDLAADIRREVSDGFLVSDVQRHDFDAQRAQSILAAERLPRFGDADEHDRRAGCLQGRGRLLTDNAAPVRHKSAPELRIGRHLTPLLVVGHVGCLTFRMGEGHGLSALVQLQGHHDRMPLLTIGMQVRHDGRPAFHSNEADAPWRTLAEMHVGRNVQGRFRQKRAAPWRIGKEKVGGQARRTGIARRITEGPAGAAALQDEASFGGRPREPVRRAAARARRQCRKPRPQQRILPTRPCDRLDHEDGPARIAAPEARPRS